MISGSVPASAFPLLAPNGSAGAPSYSFINSPTTGMYSAGANQLDFSTNGVAALLIDANQTFAMGSANSLIHTITANGTAVNGTSLVLKVNTTGGQTDSGGSFGITRTVGNGVLSISGSSSLSDGAVLTLNGGTSANPNLSVFSNAGSVSGTIDAAGNWTLGRASTTSNTITGGTSYTGTAIKGTTTNNSAGAGNVGEYIESVISVAVNAGTTATWTNLTSISLTAGDWQVTGVTAYDANGATITPGTGNNEMAVSVNSGTTTTDQIVGSNQLPLNTALNDRGQSIPSYRLSLAATTTVYLKMKMTYTVATPQQTGRLSAWRMR